MQGQLPVGAIPGVVLVVANLTLHVVVGIGSNVVAIVQMDAVFQSGIEGGITPLCIYRMVEFQLVLYRTVYYSVHLGFTGVFGIIVPTILITLPTVLNSV